MEEYGELPVLMVSNRNSGPLSHLADRLALSSIESNSEKRETLHFDASMASSSSVNGEIIRSVPLVGASGTRGPNGVSGLPDSSRCAVVRTGRTVTTLKQTSKVKFVEEEGVLEEQCEACKTVKQVTQVPKIILANHPCPVCDQVCVSTEFKHHVLSHMNDNRRNEKYTCPVCDRRLSGKFSLKRHMLIHESVEPYECSLCDRTFTDRSSFTKHERRHSSLKHYAYDL